MNGGLGMFADIYRNKRVLVTGHTGFKGAWLSEWLLSLGANVAGYALAPSTEPALFNIMGLESRMHHTLGDVRDGDSLKALFASFRPEVVFHLAAQPLVRLSYQDPVGTWSTNVLGTVQVLEAVRATSSVQACVVVTSDKCYENREWPWGYRENEAMGGHDPYSASKGATELVVASYRRSFFAEGTCHLASGRAGNVIGGGDWSKDRIVTDFVSSIIANKTLYLRNPHATRPWQHVLEPLSGYLHLGMCLLSERATSFAEGWNFGPSEESVIEVQELAHLLVDHWGQGKVEADSSGLHPHEAGLLKLDCGKARHAMGWHGVWDVSTTVANVVDWYRTHAQNGNVAELTRIQIGKYCADASRQGLPWAGGKQA